MVIIMKKISRCEKMKEQIESEIGIRNKNKKNNFSFKEKINISTNNLNRYN